MSATTVKLLQAALEIAGGAEALAKALRMEVALLTIYMADRRPLPDALLLRAVDLILADRQANLSAAPQVTTHVMRNGADAT
jgi:hypothetical protein